MYFTLNPQLNAKLKRRRKGKYEGIKGAKTIGEK
jgi:hypothetical protein